MAKSKPMQIHLKLIEIMKRFPDGLTCGQARQELQSEGHLSAEEHTHLDRRWRQLPTWFQISKTRITHEGQSVVRYTYSGEKSEITDHGQISLKVRAEVIHAAHGRCEMCGWTIQKHGIVLVVDHKLPRDWGGTNDRENLWAICEACNGGKKSHFASLKLDPEMMKQIMSHGSVHVRIGELLKAFGLDHPTPSYLIEIVSGENQDDWKKRLRELRYPVIGWDIHFKRYTDQAGKVRVNYLLRSFCPWPKDPTATIALFEKERKRRNKPTEDTLD